MPPAAACVWQAALQAAPAAHLQQLALAQPRVSHQQHMQV
jgi:hypothetical protein